MKSIFTYTFFIFILIQACCERYSNINEMNIEGDILNCQGKTVELLRIDVKGINILDSSIIHQGRFKFEHIKLESPEILYLSLNNGQTMIEFFAENSRLEMKIDLADKGKFEIKGSKTHDDYLSFLENYSVFEKRLKDLQKQSSNEEEMDVIQINNGIDSIYSSIYNDQKEYIINYVKENPGSFVSLYLLSEWLPTMLSDSEIEKLKNILEEPLKETLYYKKICGIIETSEKIKIGKQAPDFSLSDIHGKDYSLSALQQNYVVLIFLGSWNHKSILYLRDLKKQLTDKDKLRIKLFSVCIESNVEDWNKLIDSEQLTQFAVSDLKGADSEVLSLYGVREIPKIFILDKNGMILSEHFENEDIEKILPINNK